MGEDGREVAEAWRAEERAEAEWERTVMEEFSKEGADSPAVSANRVVVIGGSALLQSSFFSGFQKRKISGLTLNEGKDMVFISRHACGLDEEYAQPHLVDHRRIWGTIKELQPRVVLGVCSVGSLQPNFIPVGSILCPDDWLQGTMAPLSFYDDARAHVRPTLDVGFRDIVLSAIANDSALAPYLVNCSDLVYYQTRGPRFETKAEIRMIKSFAHVVGMTAGDEATLACELGIPYVMLCFVDNLAHGLSKESDQAISNIEAFRKAQRENLARVELAVSVALKALTSSRVDGSMPIPKELSIHSVDILIRAGFIATVDNDDRVLTRGLVAIRDGQIVGVHSEADSPPPYSASEIVELPDSMVMPGLINAHTHAAMTLMRGFGDDLKLTDWYANRAMFKRTRLTTSCNSTRLVTRIWPAEARCVSPEYVRDGTRLAIEEMIASGTTTFQDMYFFPVEIERICNELGVRAVIGQVIIEFPSAMARNAEEYLRLTIETLERRASSHMTRPPLVTYAVSPHAPYSVSEEHMLQAKAIADKYQCIFHTHLHESEDEITASEKLDLKNGFCHRCQVASRPLANLHRIGLLGPSCSFAHMTQLTDEEIAIIAENGCHVVHCPSSNLKLASGFCPVAKLMEHGVNVALGTDGACSNNSLDMVAEVKLAALLAKGVSKSAEAVNATQALRMATINGARALGLSQNVGSIEVGKRADLIAVDLSNRNACRPVYDPVSSFVYSASRDCVQNVWIDGVAKLRNGVRVNGDDKCSESELRRCSEKWQRKMEEVVRELQE